jgi:rhodanese-related sulfurtransferase
MMSCSHIKMLQSEGWILVDVREKYEYINRHIERAVNIKIANIHDFKAGSRYMVYCQSGIRSAYAESRLRQEGITVMNLGGIHKYIECSGFYGLR